MVEGDRMLNIEGSQDLKNFDESGAGAVGLYRTESLFIRQNAFPMRRQYTEYAAVVRAAGGQLCNHAKFDMGGQVIVKDTETADRSFMGFRAIRLCRQPGF